MQDEHDERSQWLGRAGFAARGVVYGLVGAIAIAVAVGAEKNPANATGALASLADGSLGKVLLIAIAAGLGGYAVFRSIEVFRGRPRTDGGEDVMTRISSGAQAIIYGGLCLSAVRLVLDAGGGGGGSEKQATSTVFDLPAGVALVFVGGAILVGVGVFQAYQSLTDGFEEDLETERMSPAIRRLANVTGVVGHAARAVIYSLVGGFLIKAAVEHDAKDTIGLDGALQELAQQSFGPLLLFAVAAGLFTYGAYCLIEARYHRF